MSAFLKSAHLVVLDWNLFYILQINTRGGVGLIEVEIDVDGGSCVFFGKSTA